MLTRQKDIESTPSRHKQQLGADHLIRAQSSFPLRFRATRSHSGMKDKTLLSITFINSSFLSNISLYEDVICISV